MSDRPIALVGSRILELDPSPMLLGFETRAGVDITGPQREALRSHASRG